jgi:hypothetical protein
MRGYRRFLSLNPGIPIHFSDSRNWAFVRPFLRFAEFDWVPWDPEIRFTVEERKGGVEPPQSKALRASSFYGVSEQS